MSKSPAPAEIRPKLQPVDFGNNWNTLYYEILQDYYWEPQHLGRATPKPAIFANEKEMLANIRLKEVSLNHILSLFFSLAPRDFIHGLEKEVFGDHSETSFRNVDLFELRRTAPHDPTQPDVFLVSDDTCLSMEVKIGAKSNLQQVVKYAILHHDCEKRRGAVLKSRLIYLTPRPISATWKENYPDVDTMRVALDHFDYSACLKKAKMSHALTSEELKAAAISMQVTHITFSQLNELMMTYASAISPTALYSNTVKQLFAGLLHEFHFRRDLLNL